MSPRYDEYFEPTRPRRTDQGIKARSQRGEFVKNWWAERWIKALERLMDPGRLRRGRAYARSGQVLSIEESEGGIRAKVQGSRPKPYTVSIHLTKLTDREWSMVLKALSERAIFAAQLLAGEMPHEIEEAFADAGVTLFPMQRNDLMTTCSCPDPANPCKHVAATHYILGEQFDEDPFLLFRLRGRSQEQIISGLRANRSSENAQVLAETPVAYALEEAGPPLEEELAHFWSLQQPLAHFTLNLKPPVTRRPLLKRLGQPPFLAGNLDLLLGPAYDAISEAALAAALADNPETDDEDNATRRNPQ
ncbi:MAG TPA: hypothetical protein PKE45_02970 [Caldilineaceae bacterium]|nr:hypothetical protein [Caldilineaceae bacterium]